MPSFLKLPILERAQFLAPSLGPPDSLPDRDGTRRDNRHAELRTGISPGWRKKKTCTNVITKKGRPPSLVAKIPISRKEKCVTPKSHPCRPESHERCQGSDALDAPVFIDTRNPHEPLCCQHQVREPSAHNRIGSPVFIVGHDSRPMTPVVFPGPKQSLLQIVHSKNIMKRV